MKREGRASLEHKPDLKDYLYLQSNKHTKYPMGFLYQIWQLRGISCNHSKLWLWMYGSMKTCYDIKCICLLELLSQDNIDWGEVGGLRVNTYFLTVLEARCLRLRCQQDWCLLGSLCDCVDGYLAVSSRGLLSVHMHPRCLFVGTKSLFL